MKVSFAIIGHNWGKKIYNIIKELGYTATILPIYQPNKYKFYQIYKKKLIKLLNKSKKKYQIVWIAIKPKKKFLFDITKISLENNFNLIIEKPWVVNKNKTNILKKIQKKNKLLVGFHFEYIYLDFFKKFKQKNISNFKIISNFHVRDINLKKSHKLDLGSHLMAIKNFYFSKNRKFKIETGYKKNLRKIIVENKNKKYELDFTFNKEKIIQKFIKDYVYCLKKNRIFKLNFDFAKRSLVK